MGRRGPRPQPTALKRAQGVRPDRVNAEEPTPPPGAPRAPEWLCPEGRLVWHRLAPELHRAGVLFVWDAELFGVFCDLVVQVGRARDLLRAGLLAKGRRDRLVTNPAWRIYRDGIGLLRGLAQEFGLTPSARSTLRLRGVLDPVLAEVVELAAGGASPANRRGARTQSPHP
jgi:P27 family predicted phage terminase small subunit